MFIDAAGSDCLKVWAGIGDTTSVTRGVEIKVSSHYLDILNWIQNYESLSKIEFLNETNSKVLFLGYTIQMWR